MPVEDAPRETVVEHLVGIFDREAEAKRSAGSSEACSDDEKKKLREDAEHIYDHITGGRIKHINEVVKSRRAGDSLDSPFDVRTVVSLILLIVSRNPGRTHWTWCAIASEHQFR